MPFDNFYEESDKAARRWRKCVGAAFLLFIGYRTAGLLIAPEPKTVEQRPREAQLPRIAEPPPVITGDKERLRRVKELCAKLPTPEKFYLIGTETLVDSPDLTLVRHTFKSNREWDELMPSFLVWLSADGWKALPSNSSTFTKNNQTIAFSRVLNDLTNYAIYCSEKPGNGDEAISLSG
jgi:hypothetical protein